MRSNGHVVSLVLILGAAFLCNSMQGNSLAANQANAQNTSLADRLGPDITNRVNEALGLHRHDIVSVEFDDVGAPGARASLAINGRRETLDLQPHSVRSQGYQLIVQTADGTLVRTEPGPLRTMRGEVRGVEGSAVAASMEADGMHARVFMPDGEQFWVQPLVSAVHDSQPGHYVVYRNADVAATDQTDVLLSTEDGGEGGGSPDPGDPLTAEGACDGGICTAELACDADLEFFQYWGSVAAVEDRVNAVINAMNIQYERDVAITHAISAVVVRTAEPDPYSSTDAVTLLNQFRSEWLNNLSDVPRDVGQLFTGKNMVYDGSSSIIGIAWLSGVCQSTGFSVVEQWGSMLSHATDLSAHELGHNWGAGHCSCSSPAYTMNAYLTGANVFHSSFSIPDITAFRDAVSCLSGTTPCQSDAECDDGDACNGAESCAAGSCSAGVPVDCADGNACTLDQCDGLAGCSHEPVDCDDGNACTLDSCDTVLGCVNDYDESDCDDGDTCTVDACDAVTGLCTNEPSDCDDGNACTADECDPLSGCVNSALTCDDVDACTTVTCDPSTGCSFAPLDCNGPDPCTVYGCDPNTGCWNEPMSTCCGNALCESGEDCDSCPEDCSSTVVGCGNGVCEPSLGEDCQSCGTDCRGQQNGNPRNRFCCGDGDGTNPVGCEDAHCIQGEYDCSSTVVEGDCCGDGSCSGGEDGTTCELDCGPAAVCGNGTCEAGEGSCDCPLDCGDAPTSESDCVDGHDDDCDGAVDCGDTDCAGDVACESNCVPTHTKEKGVRCSDGLDNDCDGLTDGDDPDCQ